MDFYGVGFDPTETLNELEAYRERNEFVYQTAVPASRVVPDFGVTVHSTKVALDGSGIIVYRAGKGGGNEAAWRQVFADLAAGR